MIDSETAEKTGPPCLARLDKPDCTYRGNYQPGDGHYSAIGAVTGVGRIAALYRVCYDCGALMYSSLNARVSLYYLLVLLSLFYNMFTFTHEKVELFTIVMPTSNIDPM